MVRDVPEDNDRDEAPGERLDRQWSELLQELRVTQTGIQLLGGFLLILPFQSRFADLGPGLTLVFLTAVVTATLSTFCVLAPVAMHRALFRSHQKDVLVDTSDVLTRIGLTLLAVTTVLVAALVFGFVAGPVPGVVAAAVASSVCLVLWWGLPMLITRRRPEGRRYGDSENRR